MDWDITENKTTTYTGGNVIVENINKGDIHYEYEYGIGFKNQVLTKPKRDGDGIWRWTSKNITSNKVINYMINPKYIQAAPKLYDYEAYEVKRYV